MSYKTFDITNGELSIGEPCNKQYKEYSEDMNMLEDEICFMSTDEPEYGSDLIDIGLDS